MMEDALRQRLTAFLQPLYQDLDGVSRFAEVERVASIARRLHAPAEDDARQFELLLLFHGLGRWLEKIGHRSRAVLTIGLSDDELRTLAASIRRLDEPTSDAERALATAILIDSAGVRGLAERLAHARREGNTIWDAVRNAASDTTVPEWMPEAGREWLAKRHETRREVCRQILEELTLADLQQKTLP
jgi:hypothetical protein